MTPGNVVVALMLAICVLVAAVCCLTLLRVKDAFNRMPYLAPVTSVSILALLVAVAYFTFGVAGIGIALALMISWLPAR